jgi:hypothetical protein
VTSAYALVDEVKARLSQDVPNMGSGRDQSIADKILEVSRDIDREVACGRGDLESLFSFIADRQYGQQVVSLSSTPRPTSGYLTLTFAGETTIPIDFNADATAVQSILCYLTTVGEGNAVVSGGTGGPWRVDFAGTLSGPQPAMVGYASVDTLGASVTVQQVISGVAEVPSERRFVAYPDLYGRTLLPIHACLSVQDVAVYNADGSVVRSMTEGIDYMTWPLNARPIEALKCLSSYSWPAWPAMVGVRARWGWAEDVIPDVREVAIIEVIRSYLSDAAGNDDRLGMTPFGSVVTAKAYTSKFRELVDHYGKTLW